ncbi:phage terminase large subunit [Bradyrhizobium sp. G127]|uniref:phage terminase large subunit n=1 Tax=Bradyrhizobium sp. G127 TaxID=2904800 RepID=UPI001F381758|nr:phage terminase large subunit [Bradyrhizobium sp. G127]MCF2523915.1 phage terminase large subunit [Bradyrhizobium sp. G127]
MTTDVAPEALAELERRLLERQGVLAVRRSLSSWARYCGYVPARHHQIIMDELERFVATDEFDVLLFHAPPGCAKSTYISQLFPPWYLANYPQNNTLFATHSDDFAMRWGRRVRASIKDCSDVLGISLSASNAASDNFSIEQGGEYYAVGAGKGISGFRADLGLCDDLFGNREDAWSNTVREKRWDWYTDDFGSRLKPGAKRILMNTRWHEMDVAGRIVSQIEAGKVRGKIIDIPAIAGESDPIGRAPGEYLWDDDPAYKYGDFLRARQNETSPMMWAALFQQKPAPEDGDYFKAEWLRAYDQIPDRKELRIYGASDYAVSADKGDYTVHAVVGIDPKGDMYLLDLWRKQAASDEWVESFCDLVRQWQPMAWAEESGQIKSGVGPFLEKRLRERHAYVYRQQFPTRGDKAVRAQSIRGRMAMKGLYVPMTANWYPDFKAELMSFPAGRHDDAVDALGLIGQLLDQMVSGSALKPEKKTYRDRWDEVFSEDENANLSWKAA